MAEVFALRAAPVRRDQSLTTWPERVHSKGKVVTGASQAALVHTKRASGTTGSNPLTAIFGALEWVYLNIVKHGPLATSVSSIEPVEHGCFLQALA